MLLKSSSNFFTDCYFKLFINFACSSPLTSSVSPPIFGPSFSLKSKQRTLDGNYLSLIGKVPYTKPSKLTLGERTGVLFMPMLVFMLMSLMRNSL